jgi:RNA recognition motif-containing protein
MSLSLHVGNLPFSVKSRDLASVFENLSGYEDAKVTVDGNSKSRGFGLVTFANAGAAAAAMESLQGNPIGEGDKAREMKIAEVSFCKNVLPWPRSCPAPPHTLSIRPTT